MFVRLPAVSHIQTGFLILQAPLLALPRILGRLHALGHLITQRNFGLVVFLVLVLVLVVVLVGVVTVVAPMAVMMTVNKIIAVMMVVVIMDVVVVVKVVIVLVVVKVVEVAISGSDGTYVWVKVGIKLR
jgi:hypothetical protein